MAPFHSWEDPAPIAPWNYRAIAKGLAPRTAGSVLTSYRCAPATPTYKAYRRWKRYLSRYSYWLATGPHRFDMRGADSRLNMATVAVSWSKS